MFWLNSAGLTRKPGRIYKNTGITLLHNQKKNIKKRVRIDSTQS